MAVFVQSVAIICFKFLFVHGLGPTATLTNIKLQTKTNPAFLLFLFAYSDHVFKKFFNSVLFNYSLRGLCRFPAGDTHIRL